MKTYRRVLTIAGSDSGAGAGIQADLKTYSALGCYGMSVITAVTAQNTQSVAAVHPVPGDIIAAQLHSVMADMGADAVKIGMLYSAEAIRTVSEILYEYPAVPVVLDPVLAAQSGKNLLQTDARDLLQESLMPLVTLLTPNLPEAESLLNRPIESEEDIRDACRDLSRFGSRHILIKGGHRQGDQCIDWLFDADRNHFTCFRAARVDTRNDHGTGCTLSAAAAAFLARGETVESAVALAKDFVSDALAAGKDYRIGRGRGPLHHFYSFW